MSEKKFLFEVIVHYILMALMVIIIFFSIFYVYVLLQSHGDNDIMIHEIDKSKDEDKGKSHPLPNFIIDKIKPDELKQLKP